MLRCAVGRGEDGMILIQEADRLNAHSPLGIFSRSEWYLISSLPAFKKIGELTTKIQSEQLLLYLCRACLRSASICSSLSSLFRGWLGFQCFILDTSLTRWSQSIIDLHFISKSPMWLSRNLTAARLWENTPGGNSIFAFRSPTRPRPNPSSAF